MFPFFKNRKSVISLHPTVHPRQIFMFNKNNHEVRKRDASARCTSTRTFIIILYSFIQMKKLGKTKKKLFVKEEKKFELRK